jgi:peptidoglycan hydrolase-like protein with peptidoglycan-binding domain
MAASASSPSTPSPSPLPPSAPLVLEQQRQLAELGFLAGPITAADNRDFSLATRDFQRRARLRPDGIIGVRTRAALSAALARPGPAPTSFYRQLRRQGEELQAQGLSSDDHLPLLDRGLAGSRFEASVPAYARHLEQLPQGLVPYPAPSPGFGSYPRRGQAAAILSGQDGLGGLEFLSEEVAQACVAIGSFGANQPLRVRWYGRQADAVNVQFWSATKIAAALHVLCQANRRSPMTPIGDCRIGSGNRSAAGAEVEVEAAAGGAGFVAGGEGFGDLFRQMVSYEKDAQSPGHSNALGALFKTLVNPGEENVQQWLRQLTANPSLVLMGRYGTPSYIQNGVLFGPPGVLVGYREPPRTRNLVSAADLVRLLTLVGWHRQLGPDQRLAGAQWTSLRTVVEGLGHDSARYIDAALENLGLVDAVTSPVILSKLGYGAETNDRSIDALTYTAFAQFSDLRSGQPRQRSFALALRIPTAPGAGVRHDARMAAEVTEIVRRVFAEQWS